MRRVVVIRQATVAAAAVLLAGCGPDPRDSVTDPASPQAAHIDALWTLILWLGTAVWIGVMVLLAVPLLRSRRRRRERPAAHAASTGRSDPVPAEATPSPGAATAPAAELDEPLAVADPREHLDAQTDQRVRSRLLWLGGIVVPAVILLVLLVAAGRVGGLTAHVERAGELEIEVVGHMFWWEVHYPELGITTANEIHVPVDRPVRLNLTTDDVIHSFWIPRVHGKIDMIPGRENQLTFEPTTTGRFRGQCAEYCGIAHAQMVAFLEVQEPDEFDAWVDQQQRDAVEPETESQLEGQRVFLDAGCAACHTVAGTEAVAGVGPDLTNLASRGSLAAGIRPNTRDDLRELIIDPWGVKPGNPMPPTILDDDELEALLDYLEALE